MLRTSSPSIVGDLLAFHGNGGDRVAWISWQTNPYSKIPKSSNILETSQSCQCIISLLRSSNVIEQQLETRKSAFFPKKKCCEDLFFGCFYSSIQFFGGRHLINSPRNLQLISLLGKVSGSLSWMKRTSYHASPLIREHYFLLFPDMEFN